MKRILIFALLSALVLMLCGCTSSWSIDNGGYAEILMPGNTLVTGHYDEVIRTSNGWAKIHINGEWYIVDKWRVAFKED